jgi:hypothetical protein
VRHRTQICELTLSVSLELGDGHIGDEEHPDLPDFVAAVRQEFVSAGIYDLLPVSLNVVFGDGELIRGREGVLRN